MENNYDKNRELFPAEKPWSSAEIASIAVLLRPANISAKRFPEIPQISRSHFSWHGVRMNGTKTEYAGLIFVNSQLYGSRRRRASEYHDQPDVVVKRPTRYKNKQTKKINLSIHSVFDNLRHGSVIIQAYGNS